MLTITDQDKEEEVMVRGASSQDTSKRYREGLATSDTNDAVRHLPRSAGVTLLTEDSWAVTM